MSEATTIADFLKKLGRRGCKVRVGTTTPYHPNNQLNHNELWTDLGLDKTKKSKWLNMKPGTPYARTNLSETADIILELLRNDCDETWRSEFYAARNGENPDPAGFGAGEEHFTKGQLLDAVHKLWGEGKHKDHLKECIALVEEVHRARLAAPDAPKRAATRRPPQPEHAPLLPLPERAQLLALPERSDPPSLAVRRRLFLRPPEWQYVCAGGYCERPVTQTVANKALGFLNTVCDRFDQLQLQVFWIGGRSGDGKSILLLQTIKNLLQLGRPESFVRFRSPDQLIEWLGQTDLNVARPAANAPVILVVDDLHKCADWRAARTVFEEVAASGKKLAIMTCGPTPERGLFKVELGELLALTSVDVPMMGEADHQVFAEFLELEPAGDTGNVSETLVEHLFLALRRDSESLNAFAESLSDRVDRYSDHAGLFKQLITMTMLDLDLPTTNVASASAKAWLDQLASDTQLHVGTSEQGYRFGHPAIASALFDVVTRTSGVPRTIEDRLVDILVPILTAYPRDRLRLAIRQIRVRAKSIGADPILVVQSLFAKASTADLKRNATFALLSLAKHSNEEVGAELIAIARTARDNVANPPEDRADLASLLAIINPTSEQDQQEAVDCLVDEQMGPWMDIFIHWLASKDAVKLRRSRFNQIEKWILRNPRKGVSTTILTKLLKERSVDQRLRTLVLNHMDEVGFESLNISYVTILAAKMENDLRDVLEEWLEIHSEEDVSSVYATLLKKTGSAWHNQVYTYLSGLDWESKKIFNILTMLIPHLDSAKVSDPALSSLIDAKLSDLFTAALDNPKADHLFSRLAECRGTQFVNLIEARLLFLETARSESPKVFMNLLTIAWPKLSGLYPQRAQDIARIIRQVVSEESETRSARAATHFAHGILENSRSSLKGVSDALVEVFDRLPHGLTRGLVACRLLVEVSNPHRDTGEYLRFAHRRHEFREEVLLCAKTEENAFGDRGNFGRALIDAMLPEEYDEIKAWIETKRGHSLRISDSKIIARWLRHGSGRNHAINLICDNSFDTAFNRRIRSACAVKSINTIFSFFDGLRQSHQIELLKLLEQGIGDYEWNERIAWVAWTLRDRWPKVAEKHIWRGILTAGFVGDVLNTQVFIDAFTEWQAVHTDEKCQDILSSSLRLETTPQN